MSLDERSRESAPHLSRYIDSLPRGLDSYPECQTKGAITRSIVESISFAPTAGVVPEPLLDLIERPPPVSSWIPEVHGMALLALARDRGFKDDETFLAWVKDRNHKLMQGPLYRALMAVASPQLLLRGSAFRWGAFHRGSKLYVEMENKHARARILYPVGLFDALMSRGMGKALEAVLESAGAKRVRMTLVRITPGLSEMEGTWE